MLIGELLGKIKKTFSAAVCRFKYSNVGFLVYSSWQLSGVVINPTRKRCVSFFCRCVGETTKKMHKSRSHSYEGTTLKSLYFRFFDVAANESKFIQSNVERYSFLVSFNRLGF